MHLSAYCGMLNVCSARGSTFLGFEVYMSSRALRASRIAPLLLALFAPGIAFAASAVVTPLVAKGVDAKVSGNVTGLLSSELDFSGAYETVTETPTAVTEKCLASATCLGGIAKTAGADAVLAGTVGTGPEGLQVFLVLYDGGKIKNKATFDIAGDPASLADNAGKWVKQLVSGQSPAAAAVVEAPPSFEEEEGDGFEFDAPPKSTSKSTSKSTTTTKTRIDTTSTPRELADGDFEEDEDDGAAAAAKSKSEAAAKAKAEAEAKAKADAEAKAKAEAAAKAKAKADAERKAREDAERLAREEEAAEEAARQAARAKAEAARRAREAEEAEAAEASEEPSGDDDDFSFGSSAALIAIETDGEEEEEIVEDEEEEEAPVASSRSTSSRSSASTSRSGSSSSRDEEPDEEPEEEEDEFAALDEEENPRDRSRDFDEDEDDDRRTTSKSRDLDEDDRDSRSSRTSGQSSRSASFDEDDRGSSRSSTRIDRADEKPGIALTARGGYSRYYDFNFITYGAELAIPVAPVVQIIAGIEGFSTQRQLSDVVIRQLADEQQVDPSEINAAPWNTILPINFGVLYKSSKNAVRPYGGVDLTLTPYTANFDVALGARLRAGADFMLADSFGLNLNLSAGILWGDKFDETQAEIKDFGLIPQISAGTVFQF